VFYDGNMIDCDACDVFYDLFYDPYDVIYVFFLIFMSFLIGFV